MKKRKVRVTNTGYLPNSPDRHNPMNIIPSNQITMDTVPFPILGIDNMGNRQMMMPGMDYTFPGQYVTEIPMGKYQEGGSNFKTKLSAEEEEQFKKFFQTLPDNLRADDSMYDIRGYWDASGRPEEFDYSEPTQEDGYYHAFSRHPETGKILKAPTHPTFNYAVDKTPLGDDTYVPLIGVDGNVYMRDLNWDAQQAFEKDTYQKGGPKDPKPIRYSNLEEYKKAKEQQAKERELYNSQLEAYELYNKAKQYYDTEIDKFKNNQGTIEEWEKFRTNPIFSIPDEYKGIKSSGFIKNDYTSNGKPLNSFNIPIYDKPPVLNQIPMEYKPNNKIRVDDWFRGVADDTRFGKNKDYSHKIMLQEVQKEHPEAFMQYYRWDTMPYEEKIKFYNEQIARKSTFPSYELTPEMAEKLGVEYAPNFEYHLQHIDRPIWPGVNDNYWIEFMPEKPEPDLKIKSKGINDSLPEPKLVTYNIPQLPQRETKPVMRSSSTHRTGQYQIGEDTYNPTTKKWERKLFKDEEADWYRNQNLIKKQKGGLTKYQGNKGSSQVIEQIKEGDVSPVLEVKGERPGLWTRFKQSYFSPENWGRDDLSDNYPEGHPMSNYMNVLLDQRNKGNTIFMWKNKQHTTEMPWLTPKEQLEQTGITDSQLYPRSMFEEVVNENIDPFSYENKGLRAMLGLFGIKEQRRKDRDSAPENIQDKPFMGARTDAFNLSMGKPQRRNTFSLSDYRPSKSPESGWSWDNITNNTDYYAINKLKDPKIQKELIDVYFNRLDSIDNLSKKYNLTPELINKLKENKLESTLDSVPPKEILESYLNDYGIKPTGNFDNDLAAYKELAQLNNYLQEYDPKTKNVIYTDSKAGVMGNFTLGQGVDENGKKYVSYYDKWDIETPGGMIPFGKPYHIYDRMYYQKGGLIKYQKKGQVTCPEGYYSLNGKCYLKYPFIDLQDYSPMTSSPDFDESKLTESQRDMIQRSKAAIDYWTKLGYVQDPQYNNDSYFGHRAVKYYFNDFKAPDRYNDEEIGPLFHIEEGVEPDPNNPNIYYAPSFDTSHFFGITKYEQDPDLPKLKIDITDQGFPTDIAYKDGTEDFKRGYKVIKFIHPDLYNNKTALAEASEDKHWCPGCVQKISERNPSEGYYIIRGKQHSGQGELRHWTTDDKGTRSEKYMGSVLNEDWMSPEEFEKFSQPNADATYNVQFDPSKTIYKTPEAAYKVLEDRWRKSAEQKAVERRKAEYEKIQKQKKQGGVYLGDYEFKNGGLVKMPNGGPKEKGWREYKTPTGESLYLDPRFKNQRYYVNEKGDHVTPDQNMSLYDVTDNVWESGTSMNTLNISAEEATPFLASIPEDVKAQMLDQGTISPATTGAERLKNQFIYAMDQPLDAMGSLMQRGYVPQGNLNGDYKTASPMSSVIGAFNPASVLMDIGRVGRDLGEKETYTTWGGAGEAGLNVAGFLPFGDIAKKVIKNLPSNVYNKQDLLEFNKKHNLGSSLEDIQLEDYKHLPRKDAITIDRNDAGPYSTDHPNFTREDQQKAFEEAQEFNRKWAYNEEGLADYEKNIRPKMEEYEKAKQQIWTDLYGEHQVLTKKMDEIDKLLDDPKNFEKFDALNEEYNELNKKRAAIVAKADADDIEVRKKIEELESSIDIYDKDFERKALAISNSDANVHANSLGHNPDKLPPIVFNKDRNKLVYYDKEDPSFKNLLKEERDYLDSDVDKIAGVKKNSSTITLGTKGKPITTTHLVNENGQQYLVDLNQNVLVPPENVGWTNAHEIYHDYQDIGGWGDVLAKFDDKYDYYTSNPNTDLGKRFGKAMVTPDENPWRSSPNELGSDLMGARYKVAKQIMNLRGLSMDEAIKVLKQDRDDFTDYLIHEGSLDRFFKPETTQGERRDLVKIMPALAPALGLGYLGKKLYDSQQQEQPLKKSSQGVMTFKDGGIYLGRYNFQDGGLVSIQDDNSYQYGGKTVSQVWVEKTGLPWKSARKLGLSDGSYDRNIQLREELIKGEHDNLNKNPRKNVVPQIQTNNKKTSQQKPKVDYSVSRKPQSKSKPLSLKYGTYDWSNKLNEDKQTSSGQNTFDQSFGLQKKPLIAVPQQKEEYHYPTFAEFQKQKLESKLNKARSESKSSVLPNQTKKVTLSRSDYDASDIIGNTNLWNDSVAESTNIVPNYTPSLEQLDRDSNFRQLKLIDEAMQSQKATLKPNTRPLDESGDFELPSPSELAKKMFLPLPLQNVPLENVWNEGVDYFNDFKESATKKLEEYGIIEPSTEGNLVKFEDPQQETQQPVKNTNQTKNFYIPPTQLAEDNNADYGEPENKFWGFRYQNSNNEGLVYIPTPRREKLNKNSKFSNVKGVAHFLIQTDATDGFIDPQTKVHLEKDLKDGKKYVPFIKKEVNGRVRLKYAKGIDEQNAFKQEGFEPFTTLRTINLSDIAWDKSKRPEGFRSGISNVLTKGGKDTWLVYKEATGKGKKLGQFNGGALVFIIETPNGRVIRDFTGTIQEIEKESKRITKEFGIPENKVTLGFYDAGSYTAKPKANKNNELYFNQYSGFNVGDKISGAALMVPSDLEQGGQITAPQFKNGGLVKAQEGREMPFGLPLKEQNVYLVPEYNQPRNPMTGEILPDPQRPNLGMDTGATEYKYTYGTDEGNIDVPSIVSGQYIGDQALDRYMLTGERFKTMNDPGSYSKFYDQIGQLGLMQQKNGGSVRKVKIKSLPRKNQ